MTLNNIDISKWCSEECKICEGAGFTEDAEVCDCIIDKSYEWADNDGTLHLHADKECNECLGAGEYTDIDACIPSAYCYCLDFETSIVEYCTSPDNPPDYPSAMYQPDFITGDLIPGELESIIKDIQDDIRTNKSRLDELIRRLKCIMLYHKQEENKK